MAYGTESIPKVYKIFGPGNQYVTAAKQLVSLRDVAIDMPAGPSEVEVLADESANTVFVAADLLSQAEHGVDSQAMLVTTSEKLQTEVVYEVERQLGYLTRRDIAEKSLANSKLILVKDVELSLIHISTAIGSVDLWKPVINDLKKFGEANSQEDMSWIYIFITGFLGGLLALFTPCVWPIIPMTVSFFLKRSKDKKKGIRDAWRCV